MNKKKLICFDLDNTLIRSNRVHVMAFQMAFEKNRLEKIPYRRIEALLNGRHAHDVVRLLFHSLEKKEIDQVVAEHHKFVEVTGKHARQIGNVNGLLRELKKSYEIAIVSNCTHREINALMKYSKLDAKYFDYIIGKDDVRHGKPYPDEIFKAEHLANLDADFIVGDSIYDIIAAKKARVKVISVLTGLATKRELLKYKPDFIVNDANKLPKLLKRINNN